jgi:hypothetical protein
VRAALATAACLASIALVLAPAASARDVSAAEFRIEVRQTAEDLSKVDSLRGIDSVEGVRVDMEAALAGASDDELRLRLRALARSQTGSPPAQGAQDRAERILDERRFEDESTPRPFRRLLEWLSTPVREAGEAIGRAVEFVASPLPGGEATFWLLLSLLVCTAAALFAMRMARLRTDVTQELARRSGSGEALDPRRLERQAAEAERNGDLELALRLRFRAGLVRLGLAEVIPLRDSLTTGDVRRRLQQPEFDRLATAFDEVVYGRRAPEERDVEHARTGWPLVLKEAGA